MGLDLQRINVGYLLGRFLAVADSIQRYSIGHQPNRSYSDCYRASLGSTPRYVFKDIADKASAHLAKLQKIKPGLKVVLDKEYSEIINMISDIPVILSLEDQMEFVLGYQHQHQANFNTSTKETA